MLMRFAYSVTGPTKFLSHLDLLKYFAKAVKRAEIPIAYSEGFNPHPRIAFGPPRGVAIAGLREYCDMKLKEEMTAEEFQNKLNSALPKGIRVEAARVLRGKVKPLQAVINRADYTVELNGCDPSQVGERAARLMRSRQVDWVRHNPKKGDKVINLRAGIDRLQWQPAVQGGKLFLSLIFGADGSVKPAEVAAYVTEGQGSWVICRTGLFVADATGKRTIP